jgi:hypothetical protein
MSRVDTAANARFEIKFATHPIQMSMIERWVGGRSVGFFEPYPERQVNNIYFDTHDLHAYNENLSGSSARSKVRFRWYGEIDQVDAGTLEVKRRRSGLGWKLSYRVGALPVDTGDWSEIRAALRSELASDARLWFDANPQPVILNRYRRRYFESADRRLRVTFDWEQRVYDQRIDSRPNFSRRAHLPESMVVEFKFAPEDRRLASDVIQGFPVRVSRNSKYVIGVQAIARG